MLVRNQHESSPSRPHAVRDGRERVVYLERKRVVNHRGTQQVGAQLDPTSNAPHAIEVRFAYRLPSVVKCRAMSLLVQYRLRRAAPLRRRVGAGAAMAVLSLLACSDATNRAPPATKVSAASLREAGLRQGTAIWDLGVVRPGSSHRHVFKIRNASRNTWTVKGVRTSCTCTVPEVSDDPVPPGGTLQAVLEYTAGKSFGDEKRVVLLDLAGVESPLVLSISSQVRPALHIDPAALSWSRIAPGQPLRQRICIDNYSNVIWKDVKVRCDKPWIAVETERLNRGGIDETRPYERWVCFVDADTSRLGYGRHDATLSISPVAEGSVDPQQLEISVETVRPIATVPSTLFFGELKPHERATAALDLIWQLAGNEEEAMKSASCRHDFGESLQAQVEQGPNGNWRLTAALTPSGPGRVSGKVVIDFGKDVPVVEVPVSALVRN